MILNYRERWGLLMMILGAPYILESDHRIISSILFIIGGAIFLGQKESA